MAVTSAAVRTVKAGVHRHWLLVPIGSNVNQCSIAPRSSTTYRDGVEDLPTVKGDFYALGHIPNIIGAIDGTHVVLVPSHRSEQVYRNRKSYHSMNVQMVCLADQYISHVNAKFPGSVHDAYILRNSSIPYVMGQLQRHRVWLLDHRVACCMLHNVALRQQVPFLQEDGPDGGVVAAVEPVDSEDEEAGEEDNDNRDSVIQQYFQ
ncbi:hypothetical protein NDU88_004226 [Pleurodeles waltl]|uniref:DDE Tnp4 domain-containing protein n=1 Tax=Pleurodeles waltl TaxID=8319 RepID=A0AAV7WV14_PLEWA|nr:hypothetical protein NDU88_004226 [Pleurodeles waltl]